MATIESIKAEPSNELGPWFATTDFVPKPEQVVLVRTVTATGQACEAVAHLHTEPETGTMLWYSWLAASCLNNVTAWRYLPDSAMATPAPEPEVPALEKPAAASRASASKDEAQVIENLDVAHAEMEHWMKEQSKIHEMFMEAVGQHKTWVSVMDRLPKDSQDTEEFQTYCDGEFKRALWTHGADKSDRFFWGMQEEDEIEVSHWRAVPEEEDYEASCEAESSEESAKPPQPQPAASI